MDRGPPRGPRANRPRMSAIGHSRHPRARLLATMVVAAVLLMGSVADSARAGAGNVAALQVALRALHYYRGTVDGVNGALTRAAVRSFQRAHLSVSFELCSRIADTFPTRGLARLRP